MSVCSTDAMMIRRTSRYRESSNAAKIFASSFAPGSGVAPEPSSGTMIDGLDRRITLTCVSLLGNDPGLGRRVATAACRVCLVAMRS